MDSEWRETPKFIYGKVLEGSGKFRGNTEKVRNILEGVGPGQLGRPHQVRRTKGWQARAKPSGGGSPSLLPCELEKGEESLLPTSFRCVLFPFLFGKLEFELVWTRDLVGLRNLGTHGS